MSTKKISFDQISLSLSSIKKSDSVPVLFDVSFDVYERELVSIVGPSGSGKSTILNVIAGFLKPDHGNLDIYGSAKLGYVFQANCVFPWLTARQNLEYPLELQKLPKKVIKERVSEISQLVGLPLMKFADKYPKELSGGENRRLALGMVLVFGANLLLLDEPTSQLDFFTACTIQDVILSLKEKYQLTIILVTHSLEEAAFMGDRVIILDKGKVAGEVEISTIMQRNHLFRESEQLLGYRNEIIKYFK